MKCISYLFRNERHKTILQYCKQYLKRNYCASTEYSSSGFNDYNKEYENFSPCNPEYFNFAADVIDVWADKSVSASEKLALWWINDRGDERKWTFTDISYQSKKVAYFLVHACKLSPGDRLLAMLPKIPEFWILTIACIRAGIVLIPATTQLREDDIKMRLLTSGAKVILTDRDNMDKVDSAINECHSLKYKICASRDNRHRKDWLNFEELFLQSNANFQTIKTKATDPLVIFYTSGTTGAPKMTEHLHSYPIAHRATGKYWLDLTPNDINWSLSDPGWAKSSYGNLYGPWIQGSCVFIQNSNRFDVLETLEILGKFPISTFCAPPTVYRMALLEKLEDIKFMSARHFVSAGEPLNPEVIENWNKVTSHFIREGYGQSETTLLTGSFRCLPIKPGSMGKAVPGLHIDIIDDDGQILPNGQEGDIAVKIKPIKPIGVFNRYIDEPIRTAEAFRGDYYVTGDRGKKDDDDYLWFLSRADDVINSAGYRIGPFEVESALIGHPSVAESAVVASPDKLRGDIVKAFIILKPEFKFSDHNDLKADIQQHVQNVTAPYKYPRLIEFVDELPKTISGKIRRVELRDIEKQRNYSK